VAPWEAFVRALPRRVKPQREDPIRLVCFDLDGVLLDQPSSWVEVHRHFGLDNEASLHAFLRGEIDEEEFIRRDIALWMKAHRGVTLADIDRILAKSMTLTKGAKTTVRELHRAGVECAIVSSGIEAAAQRAARELGIRLVSANRLNADARGRLTGEGTVLTPLRDKAVPLRRFAKELGIPLGQVCAVGNSSPDIGMFRSAGLAIAFRPTDDWVQGAADIVLEGTSLREIIAPIGVRRLRAARSKVVVGGI
jgi:phosphoserine phosphatase